jgi:dynein heavy chain
MSVARWLRVIGARAELLLRWLRDGPPPSFLLDGLFAPAALIGAVKQAASRKHAGEPGWALDELVVVGEVLPIDKEQLRKPADDGMYVHGLHVEGARWDRAAGKLVELLPRSSGSQPLPVLWLSAVPRPARPSSPPRPSSSAGAADPSSGGAGASASSPSQPGDWLQDRYECPIYRSSARTLTHLVASVELPTVEPANKWVLRGVCLLTHAAPTH